MTNYDDFLNDTPRPAAPVKKKKKNSRDMLWNVLTGVMLLMTVCVCGVFFNIFNNPYSALNPFQPPTPLPPTLTPTITPIRFDPTWTPEPTLPPTASNTPRPTITLEPTFTPFKLMTPTKPPTNTPVVSPTRTPKPTGAPYAVTVNAVASTVYRADSTCDRMYIAGQALDSKNNPAMGLIVKLGGSLPGKSFNELTMTGLNLAYGQSGFEFDLGIAPVASKNTLWIQLLDQASAPMSEQIYLTTYADCNRNLIYIRFTQK
ncbi:MAG: hypothetical protein N2117_08370 [Anaerolineales bacterium]|nr:hypothetical protein [Anaerolineales bacterium]MCX7755247.1 hypothetical protein [Anaerolineales bacterium]MDW8278912.1 hypothetical protein [Anaerolineales bacterium]